MQFRRGMVIEMTDGFRCVVEQVFRDTVICSGRRAFSVRTKDVVFVGDMAIVPWARENGGQNGRSADRARRQVDEMIAEARRVAATWEAIEP